MLRDHFGYLRCFDGNEQNDQDICQGIYLCQVAVFSHDTRHGVIMFSPTPCNNYQAIMEGRFII